MSELLSYAEVQKLLDEPGDVHQKLIEDIVPGQINVTGIQRVPQSLLLERVSIRGLPAILEGIAEAAGFTQNAGAITGHVRARLARQIRAANTGPNGYLPLLTMSARAAGGRGTRGAGKQLPYVPRVQCRGMSPATPRR